jgi:hypothetical protein
MFYLYSTWAPGSPAPPSPAWWPPPVLPVLPVQYLSSWTLYLLPHGATTCTTCSNCTVPELLDSLLHLLPHGATTCSTCSNCTLPELLDPLLHLLLLLSHGGHHLLYLLLPKGKIGLRDSLIRFENVVSHCWIGRGCRKNSWLFLNFSNDLLILYRKICVSDLCHKFSDLNSELETFRYSLLQVVNKRVTTGKGIELWKICNISLHWNVKTSGAPPLQLTKVNNDISFTSFSQKRLLIISVFSRKKQAIIEIL